MVKKVERIDESGGVHAMWSPSAASRWLECPKSVIESQAMVSPPSSGAALEGTKAHKFCERVLLDDLKLEEIEDDTMRAGVEMYTDYVESIFETYDDPGYEVEGRVNLETLIPGSSPPYWSCFGSADFFIYDEGAAQIPEVIDFKYGRHTVEVKDNLQLMLYAFGLAEDIGYRGKVKLTIVQPRAHHQDGPIRSWTVTGKQLTDLCLRARRVLTNAHNMEKKAGDHCHYCQLASRCETKFQEVRTMAADEFGKEEFSPPMSESMTDKQISLIVKHHKAMIKWIEGVVLSAASRVRGGEKIKGTKLIRNSGRNGWTDEAAFKRMCKDLEISKADAYKLTPQGMGVIKKLLKEMYDNNPDDLIDEYISKSEGSISLVSADDARIEYNPAASEFADN